MAPAMIKDTQYAHRQDTGATYPDATGPINGPQVVAAMKSVITRPRAFRVLYMSAYTPPMTEIGLDFHQEQNVYSVNTA